MPIVFELAFDVMNETNKRCATAASTAPSAALSCTARLSAWRSWRSGTRRCAAARRSKSARCVPHSHTHASPPPLPTPSSYLDPRPPCRDLGSLPAPPRQVIAVILFVLFVCTSIFGRIYWENYIAAFQEFMQSEHGFYDYVGPTYEDVEQLQAKEHALWPYKALWIAFSAAFSLLTCFLLLGVRAR